MFADVNSSWLWRVRVARSFWSNLWYLSALAGNSWEVYYNILGLPCFVLECFELTIYSLFLLRVFGLAQTIRVFKKWNCYIGGHFHTLGCLVLGSMCECLFEPHFLPMHSWSGISGQMVFHFTCVGFQKMSFKCGSSSSLANHKATYDKCVVFFS